jgi:hypothetical protein
MGAIHNAKRIPMQPDTPIDYGYNQVLLEVSAVPSCDGLGFQSLGYRV